MFEPTSKDWWRAVILYGRNMSTYKMGLGDLIINYANKNREKYLFKNYPKIFLIFIKNEWIMVNIKK